MRELRLFIGLLFLAMGLSTAKALPTDKHVTFQLRNVSMETFIEEVKKQTGANILYNAQAFKGIEPVSAEAKGEPWDSVLKRVLTSRGFDYTIKNDIVVIHKIKIANTMKAESR